MPITSVRLVPGINTEKTPTLNEAGYSQSQLGRWKDGLFQKIGGWTRFYPFALDGSPRDMHAWQDFNDDARLAVGTTEQLDVITDGALIDITPQTFLSDVQPVFDTTASSPNVDITDANLTGAPTTYDSVYFNTPVSVGGIILSGLYPVSVALSSTKYRIVAATNATQTRSNLPISNITKANPGVVTYTGADNIANGDLVYIYGVVGMTQVNGHLFTVAGLNTGANTFQLSGVDTTGYSNYTSAGSISFAAVPQFGTTSGSATVNVTFANHGLSVGDTINFPITTTIGGVTIFGTYSAVAITSANIFTISADVTASSTTTAMMNAGEVELLYYVAVGPVSVGTGYGIGGYGDGGYGTGTTLSVLTGDPITATDWSFDNWGSTLLANPTGGGIYQWTPNSGFQNAQLISGAPIFVHSIFVAMPAQILVALGATSQQTIGVDPDPLFIRWSDQLDYNTWIASDTNQAGSFRIPTGSKIMGGLQGPQNALIWTDLDLWAMQYVGFPLVFGFNKIGSSCGLISQHAVAQMGPGIFWMGQSNFFVLTGGGATPIPCSVWDFVFQDLDQDNIDKCWAWASSTFNEVWWFFPSESGATGQCDSYVKLNTIEGAWDYGTLPRSCGIDQSILGKPIAATPAGLIFLHEDGENDDGNPISWSFRTGFWSLSDANDISFVDWILPDFRYGLLNGSQSATVMITLYSVNYPGGPETTYGPYTATSSSTYINTRLRGRQMAMQISGDDLNSFVRLGRLRVRAAPDGRY